MTSVTTDQLQNFFATIFKIDPAYIVPKGTNWFNPQSYLGTPDKPLTWLAFRLKENTPRTKAFQTVITNEDESLSQYLNTYSIAQIELQFIGQNAELYANSVKFFPERQDVSDQLSDCEGVIMNDDFRAVPNTYYQEGLNIVYAYNVNLRIEYTERIIVNQQLAQGILDISGALT